MAQQPTQEWLHLYLSLTQWSLDVFFQGPPSGASDSSFMIISVDPLSSAISMILEIWVLFIIFVYLLGGKCRKKRSGWRVKI